MRRILTLFLMLAPMAAADEDAPIVQSAGEAVLQDFLWQNRVMVVFADSDNDPRFVQQIGFIHALEPDLRDRDLVVLTDTEPAAASPLRIALRPRGFSFVLFGKDGNRYLRKPFPWDGRALSRSIDKMPIRQQELRGWLSE